MCGRRFPKLFYNVIMKYGRDVLDVRSSQNIDKTKREVENLKKNCQI